MKHQVLVDKTSYKKKPNQYAGAIQKRISNCPLSVTLSELMDFACKGHTIKVSHCTSQKGTASFVSSSLLFIDIDNKEELVVLEDVIKALESKGIYVAAAHESFSHTQERPKYHLFAQLNKEVTDLSVMSRIYDYLKQTFSFVDSAISPTGMIFGGRNLLFVKEDCVTDLDTLITTVSACFEQNSSKKTASKHCVSKDSAIDYKVSSINSCNNNKLMTLSHSPQKEGSTPCGTMLRELLEISDFVQNSRFANKRIDTLENAIAYIRDLELAELFGLSHATSCIFHEDNKASAGFYQVGSNWRYKCHSCGTNLSALDMMALTVGARDEENLEDPLNNAEIKAVCREMLKLLNITLDEDTWRLEQYKKFNQTIKILNDIKCYKEKYPKTVRRLETCDYILRVMMDKCQECIEYLPAISYDGAPLFQASYRYLAHVIKQDYKAAYRKIQFLKDMNIIHILTDEEVKAHSETLSSLSKLKECDRYTINTYMFNGLTEGILSEIEAILIEDFKMGVTSKGISDRQTIARGGKTTEKKKGDTKKVEEDKAVLLKWAKRTVNRKGCYVLADLEAYAKKTLGCSQEYTKKFVAYINNELGLTRIVISSESAKKYGLPKTAIRKTAFKA